MTTSKTPLSFTHRKQAIMLGLSAFLTGNDLEAATTYWVQHYKDKPTFAIQHFVQDIVTIYHLESQRRDITQKLITCLNKTVLSDKVEEVIETSIPSANSQHPVLNAQLLTEEVDTSEDILDIFSEYYYLEAFISIYNQLLDCLPETEKADFFNQAISSIKKNKILKKHKATITHLYRHGTLSELYDDMPDVLSEILNHLSFEMAKQYGAHLADEWLLESVQVAREQHTDEVIDALI